MSGVSSLYRKSLNQEGAGSVGSRNHRVVTAHSRGSWVRKGAQTLLPDAPSEVGVWRASDLLFRRSESYFSSAVTMMRSDLCAAQFD